MPSCGVWRLLPSYGKKIDSPARGCDLSHWALGHLRAISLALSSRQAVLEFALGVRSIMPFRHTV